MKQLLKTFILFTIFILIQSCSDDKKILEPEPDKQEVIIPVTTKPIADDDISNGLVSVSIDSTIYTFTSVVGQKYNFAKDQIIVSGVGNGFLRKITSVEKTNSEIKLTTIQASLAEAIEKGKGEFSQELNASNLQKISTQYEGIVIDRNRLSKTNGIFLKINVVLADADQDTTTKGDQIKLYGSIELGPSINGEFEINDFNLEKLKIGYEMKQDVDLNVSMGILPGFDVSKKLKYPLATVKFTPIVVPVGAVPVVIVPTFKLTVGAKLDIDASIIMGITQNITYTAGLIYENGEWNTYKKEKNAMDDKSIKLSAGISVKGYIKPEIQMRIYDVLSPDLYGELYAKVEANAFANPWWKLYGGFKVGIGVKMGVWDYNIFDVGYDLIDVKATIAEATTEPDANPTASFIVTPTSGNTDTQFQFDANTSSDLQDNTSQLNVRWDWENDGNWDTEYSTQKIITHYFTKASNYVVTLQVKDTDGNTDISSKTVEVKKIDSNKIVVTYPNSSVTYYHGQNAAKVNWYGGSGNTVVIELYKNNSYVGVFHESTANDGETVKNGPIPESWVTGSDYQIKIIDSDGNFGFSESFTIAETDPNASGVPCPGIPTVNYGGKIYNTVQIGSQCWLKENLDVGTMIESNSSNDNQTNNGIIEKYCLDNDENKCDEFGGLYQWNELMQYVETEGSQGICPDGWHIPTESDFKNLQDAVNNDANSLKAKGEGAYPNTGTNTSGFSALYVGSRADYNGQSSPVTRVPYFWSSTLKDDKVLYMYLSSSVNNVLFDTQNKNWGFSIRCIKN